MTSERHEERDQVETLLRAIGGAEWSADGQNLCFSGRRKSLPTVEEAVSFCSDLHDAWKKLSRVNEMEAELAALREVLEAAKAYTKYRTSVDAEIKWDDLMDAANWGALLDSVSKAREVTHES